MTVSNDMQKASRIEPDNRVFVVDVLKTLNRGLGFGGYAGFHLHPSDSAKFYITEGNPPQYDQGVFTFSAEPNNYALQYQTRGEKAPLAAKGFNDSFQHIRSETDFVRAIGDVAKSYWPDRTNQIDAALSRFSQDRISPEYLTLQN